MRIRRVTAAVDTGEMVNPDGIRNQIEGGIVQSASWTLFERVSFDRTRITSVDWSAYPIMRFASLPDDIDVHIIERPGAPFLGVAEAAPDGCRDRQRDLRRYRPAAARAAAHRGPHQGRNRREP